jgi:deoxyribodipyrimidine photo-lyase
VPEVAKELGAGGIHATRHYEPWWREAECEHGDFVILHDGDVLHEPATIRSGAGKPFKIYGPYYRALESAPAAARPQKAPKLTRPDKLPPATASRMGPASDPAQLGGRLRQVGARRHRRAQAPQALRRRGRLYAERRDLPAETGTSQLSTHLHFGEISPRELWHGLGGAPGTSSTASSPGATSAATSSSPIPTWARPSSARWVFGHPHRRAADADFAAWSKGRTGYPLVDAGMRELWVTGWMHNRARLVTASFLVKHLLIDWQRGADWFWDTLVDADYANNSQNWQWIAGTGFDSQPFYRIMAPLAQSEKFGAADYIRRWVPELAHLSDADIHDPWGRGVAPADYPKPLIGHREARERALEGLPQASLSSVTLRGSHGHPRFAPRRTSPPTAASPPAPACWAASPRRPSPASSTSCTSGCAKAASTPRFPTAAPAHRLPRARARADRQLNSWLALVRLATSGSVGWYKAWARGEWASPDPVPLFDLFMRNAAASAAPPAPRARSAWSTGSPTSGATMPPARPAATSPPITTSATTSTPPGSTRA